MSVAAHDLRKLVTEVVDARGRRRPGPVLALKHALAASQGGGVVELLATDPTAGDELASWAVKAGHEYPGAYSAGDVLHLFVRRGL